MSPLFLFIKILPKKLVSYLTGCFVGISFPAPLGSWLNKKFVALFKLDLSEAERPLETYKSIQEVFTRKLKARARPLANVDYISPCDGTLSLTETLEAEASDTVLQVKGFSYPFSELIGKQPGQWKPDFVSTLYLAPHNYHRVHAPVSGEIHSIKHIPGELWPVNPKFLFLVQRLFARNERLVFEIKLTTGGTCFFVMVGALNVGKMRTPFAKNLLTNQFQNKVFHEDITPPAPVKKGEELGTFMMGSTVVLGFDKEALKGMQHKPEITQEKRPVKMGEALSQ